MENNPDAESKETREIISDLIESNKCTTKLLDDEKKKSHDLEKKIQELESKYKRNLENLEENKKELESLTKENKNRQDTIAKIRKEMDELSSYHSCEMQKWKTHYTISKQTFMKVQEKFKECAEMLAKCQKQSKGSFKELIKNFFGFASSDTPAFEELSWEFPPQPVPLQDAPSYRGSETKTHHMHLRETPSGNPANSTNLVPTVSYANSTLSSSARSNHDSYQKSSSYNPPPSTSNSNSSYQAPKKENKRKPTKTIFAVTSSKKFPDKVLEALNKAGSTRQSPVIISLLPLTEIDEMGYEIGLVLGVLSTDRIDKTERDLIKAMQDKGCKNVVLVALRKGSDVPKFAPIVDKALESGVNGSKCIISLIYNFSGELEKHEITDTNVQKLFELIDIAQ